VVGLIGAGEAFDRVYQHPKVLAAVHHVLQRSFRVAQLHGREPLADFGQQGLHADARPRSASEPFGIVTTIWMIDDFTPDNGATRIVPRSHLFRNPPPKALADRRVAHHKDEMVVTGSAGTVLLFNGHLWHGGTQNRSGARRRAVQLLFAAEGAAWHVGIPENVPPGLPDAARFLLGCKPSSMT
jgi:ectoine hydroxylase-related dioxygenase (phytanoyl-CoA dioxygenase family)